MKKVYLVEKLIFYTQEGGFERALPQQESDRHYFSSKKKAKFYFDLERQIYDIKNTEIELFPNTHFEYKERINKTNYRIIERIEEIEVI